MHAGPQVFYTDINRLLSMEDMWKDLNRKKPKALDYDEIMNETFVPLPVKAKEGQSTNGDGSAVDATAAGAAAPPPADRPIPSQLRDQRQMSVKETLELFIDRQVSIPPPPFFLMPFFSISEYSGFLTSDIVCLFSLFLRVTPTAVTDCQPERLLILKSR